MYNLTCYMTHVSPCKKVWFAREADVADAVQGVTPGMGVSGVGVASSQTWLLSDTMSTGSDDSARA